MPFSAAKAGRSDNSSARLKRPLKNSYIPECRGLKPAPELQVKDLNADLKVRSTRSRRNPEFFSKL